MNASSEQISTIVVGGTGYVAGELLRLINDHPNLKLAAVASQSKAGESVASVFPHLAAALGGINYVDRAELASFLKGKVALFSAAPHGASAGLIAELIDQAQQNSCDLSIVDASADFRFTSAAAWESVYGQSHGAPELLTSFVSGLPEHVKDYSAGHAGHPGCFATAMLLAVVPLLSLDLVEPQLNAVGITGSTGSGRTPIDTTHHPYRHANLYAYKPLSHRHAPEVIEMSEIATGVNAELNFVPHSGPFARGIHMTVQGKLKQATSEEDVKQKIADYYGGSHFVSVVDGTPRLKDVVGTNYAQLGVAVNGTSVVVFSVIDNLVKGAAGGAVQWMNRLLNLEESAGLTAVAPGWL